MNQIGLFAKFWQPGTVKTRLAASIGASAACDLYYAFVSHLINRFEDIGDTRTVVFSPPDRESEFRNSIPDAWALCPQSAGDLGNRMKSFFVNQFAQINNKSNQPNKIVVIGADCHLAPDQIQAAFDLLDDTSVVLGPSTDGGYYLIAMRDTCFDVFANIEWSTEMVFDQTVRHLNDQQVKFETLPPMTDIDELDSLVALESELMSRRTNGSLDKLDVELLDRISEATAHGPPPERSDV